MEIVLGMMIVFVVFLVIFSVIFAFLESKPEPTIKKKDDMFLFSKYDIAKSLVNKIKEDLDFDLVEVSDYSKYSLERTRKYGHENFKFLLKLDCSYKNPSLNLEIYNSLNKKVLSYFLMSIYDLDYTLDGYKAHKALGSIFKEINYNITSVENKIKSFQKIKEIVKPYIIESQSINVELKYNNIPLIIGLVPDREQKINEIILSSKGNFRDVKEAICIPSFTTRDLKYVFVTENNVLETIKSYTNDLLYDLSDFQDAFDSITKIPINGYVLQETSIEYHKSHAISFNYVKGKNIYRFFVRPFDRTYTYQKNNLDERKGYFVGFKDLMSKIKFELDKSKNIVPFDVEDKPELVYNTAKGILETKDNIEYIE
ncbi:hypothetical protein BE25_0198 [Staphylococcus phage vB_SepM_BE25]|nr:hypothetical protein BE25_0198 [Staphylococcus phage vB_SepM_BE25]